MNILFLFENENAVELGEWLADQGNNVVFSKNPISAELIKKNSIELIVSYTYRHIIKKDIIDLVHGNIVNLHISYLPWNRGANPNQWSFIDNTPKGVTIHYINAGIDSGDILAQEIVPMSEDITLRESYTLLNVRIKELFKSIYNQYHNWQGMRKKALGEGSYHSMADFQSYESLIGSNYDITVNEFCKRVKRKNENSN